MSSCGGRPLNEEGFANSVFIPITTGSRAAVCRRSVGRRCLFVVGHRRTSMRPPSDDVSPIYKAPTAPCDGEIFARTLPPWPRRRLPWRPRRPRVGAPTYGTDRLNDASIRPLGRAGSIWPCISTSRVPGLEAASSVGVTPCSRPRLKMASRGTAHARIVGCSQLCQHAYLLLAGGARAYVMYGRIKAPDEGCRKPTI